MAITSGRKRVIISNILPTVDCGKFPAKIVINQHVTISADIFTDGIDQVSARVLIRHSGQKLWKELELQLRDNDRWYATFTPDKLGKYSFQVIAWINHFATWQDSIRKKHAAGQDILVDLKAGLAIGEDALTRATGKDKNTIQKWLQQLEAVTESETGMKLAEDETMNGLFCKYRNKIATTIHPQTFELIVDPSKAVFSTWYELFPRSAAAEPGKHGTFNDVCNLLPAIAKMGFDVLYFPPIHPIGLTNRKGKNNSLIAEETDPGSPWAIGGAAGGHKDIHPQLGNLKEFKKLVTTAKKQGIDIALDIAFQCSPDHPYVKQHPEWFKWRADGSIQFAENPPKRYEDILPFNFDSEAFESLWEELKSVIQYWADNGVNIFRVDNPHTKAIPFWEWAIDKLKAEYPQLIFLAEAFTRPRIMEHLAKVGFTQSYTYFAWRNTKRDLEEYMTEFTQTDLQYYFRPNFWPNTPDILTEELVHGGVNAHIARVILAGTLSSSYGIYGPVYDLNINEPRPGKEEYNDNEKYEIKHWDWNSYTKTREIISRLNRIRKENPALHITNNIEFATTDNDQIICYIKADDSRQNIMIVVVNLDPYNTQKGNIKLPLYKVGISYDKPFTVHDLLSGDKYEWNEWNFVSLNPHDIPAHVLKVIQ